MADYSRARETSEADQHKRYGAVPESRVITSAELFAGALEIAISHENSVYRLRITRQGKLVLNK